MMKTMNFRAFIIILIACITASTLFGLLYCYDNKYNTNTNYIQDGAVILPGDQNENGIHSGEITW